MDEQTRREQDRRDRTGDLAVPGAGAADDRRPGGRRSRGAAGASRLVERLLDVGIDGRGPFPSAQSVADAAMAQHHDVEKAVAAVVRSHLTLAAAGGFVTSLGGFVTMPVAVPANVVGFYAVATRAVAAVAALRGYDLRDEGVRTAVVLTLVGADANDLLRRAGMSTTGGLAGLATRRLPGPVLMALNKGIGFRLVSRAGRSALSRLGRGVPLVGGAVGAGVDGYLLKQVTDHARREFPLRLVAGA